MRALPLVLLLLLVPAPAPGQEVEAPTPPPPASSQRAEPDAAEAVAVPPATEKAMRYYVSGNWLWAVNVAWGLLVPAAFLFTGFSARLRDWAQWLGRRWFLTIAVYMLLFSAVSWVLDLPLVYYQEFVRQHAYGLSNQTFSKWFGDSLKALAVGTVIAVLVMWIPSLLLRRSPRRWWLWTSLVAIPFLFFMALIQPVYIAPLFNDFGPMKDKSLEADILALADRAGIEGSRVYEVDKSVDTNAVNAYVTGFLDTKRIVLWDTILAKLDRDEVLFVMGHEMGHYVLGHVVLGNFFISVILLVSLYLIHRTAGGLIGRYGDRFGFRELHDVASLPLLILLLNVSAFVLMPVIMGFGRHFEHQADVFGLELTRSNRAGATAFVKLQEETLANPRPGLLYKLWRSSHPPVGERIDFCNSYRPWETGQPLRFERYLKPGSGPQRGGSR